MNISVLRVTDQLCVFPLHSACAVNRVQFEACDEGLPSGDASAHLNLSTETACSSQRTPRTCTIHAICRGTSNLRPDMVEAVVSLLVILGWSWHKSKMVLVWSFLVYQKAVSFVERWLISGMGLMKEVPLYGCCIWSTHYTTNTWASRQ